MARLRTILVPTDFSEQAEQALRYATDLAASFGAEIVVAHVVHLPLYPFGFGEGSLPVIEHELEESVQEHLKAQVDAVRAKGVEAKSVLRKGETVEQLVAAVREENADLVVTATHGYTGFRHLVLGSNAEKLLRLAPCPVLVVPPRRPPTSPD